MSAAIGTMGPTLGAGVRVLTSGAEIPFTQYTRYVLPIDGYVFWRRTRSTTFTGSLHVSVNSQQSALTSPAINRVVFSSQEEIAAFNEIDPDTILIGDYGGAKFSFSQRGYYFDNANVYHYSGDAVYPTMLSQLVDVGSELSPDTVVVSNSLPAWLALRDYDPVWLTLPNPRLTLYPSFLVPQNLPPPYGVVHIPPDATVALQQVPLMGPTGTQTQLAHDTVHVSIYGLTNAAALAWISLVLQYMTDTNVIGLSDGPIIQDEKQIQNEINALAMLKTVKFGVAYDQSAVREVARQLVREVASPSLYPSWSV